MRAAGLKRWADRGDFARARIRRARCAWSLVVHDVHRACGRPVDDRRGLGCGCACFWCRRPMCWPEMARWSCSRSSRLADATARRVRRGAHLDKARRSIPAPRPHRFPGRRGPGPASPGRLHRRGRAARSSSTAVAGAGGYRKLHDDCRCRPGGWPIAPSWRQRGGDRGDVTNVPGRWSGSRDCATAPPRSGRAGSNRASLVRPTCGGFRSAHRTVEAVPGIVTDYRRFVSRAGRATDASAAKIVDPSGYRTSRK